MKTTTGLLAGCLALLLTGPVYAQEVDAATETTADEAVDDAEATVTESADATAEEAEEEAEEAEEEGKKWGVGLRVGNSIGQGTFVNVSNDSGYTDPDCEGPPAEGCVTDAANAFDRVNLSYSLSGSYQLGDFSTSIGIALVQWLTAGGGINDARETRWQDIGVSVGHAGYTFEDIGLSIGPSASFTIPTSRLSQVSTLILGTSLGVGVSKTFFEKLSLSLSIGAGKNFHRYNTPVIDAEDLEDDIDEEAFADALRPEAAIFRAGGSEDLGRGLVAVGGVNSEWSLSTGLSASIPVYDKLRFSASYGFATFWTYYRDTDDELTPDVVNVQTGRGVGQSVRTSLGLSYPIQVKDVSLGLSAGVATGQAPKTADNKSFNFPFWNFTGAARNASSLRFGISARY